jgi:hypothetical protein
MSKNFDFIEWFARNSIRANITVQCWYCNSSHDYNIPACEECIIVKCPETGLDMGFTPKEVYRENYREPIK